MRHWTSLNTVQAFLKQAEIAKDIEYCHNMLSDSLTAFEVRIASIQRES